MKLILNNIFSLSFWIGALTFGMHSIIMIVAINLWGIDVSYSMTVSSKVVLASFIVLVIWRSKPLKVLLNDKLVILFWSFWMLRLLYDGYLQYENILSHSPSYYFLSSIFFAIIPFFGGKYIKNLNFVKNGILYSSLAFCIITLVLFNELLTADTRFGNDEESISPLVLSYTASLVIGYFLVKLLLNTFNLKFLIYIAFALPVFNLGASKGSVLSLFLSVMIALLACGKIKLKYIIFSVFLFFFVQNASFFGMNVLANRFETSINDYSGQSTEKDAREIIWTQAIENISNSPIIGDFIEVKKGRIGSAYPHNIIIEAAMSTGFIGGLLLVIICIVTLQRAFFLVKTSKEYVWILIIYTQSFAQNMVTGNLYSGATWFWFMVGLVNYKYVEIQNIINRKPIKTIKKIDL